MGKKLNGLGKGLDALFIETGLGEVPEKEHKSAVNVVRISDIEPDKKQPRKSFSEESLQALADSIAIHGVLQPIVVRSVCGEDADHETQAIFSGKYRIVSGERRWRASKMAGLTEMPVVIKNLSDSEAGAVMLVENLQREDLSPVELAKGLKRLIDEYGLTHEETAKIVGISRPNLTNSLRLLSLPENVLDFLDSQDITTGHARALLSLGEEKEINEALDVVLAKQLSVRETERMVRNILIAKEKKQIEEGKLSAKEAEKRIYLEKLQERVASSLGRKAYISEKNKRKGSGKLEIEYYSAQDLEALLKGLCGEHFFEEL